MKLGQVKSRCVLIELSEAIDVVRSDSWRLQVYIFICFKTTCRDAAAYHDYIYFIFYLSISMTYR